MRSKSSVGDCKSKVEIEMAFDQNSAPKDLRPINIGRNGAEEVRISPPSTTTSGWTPDGFYASPNPVPPRVGGDVNSPPSVSVYYPDAYASGFPSMAFANPSQVQVQGQGQPPGSVWTSRMPASMAPPPASSVASSGYAYGPNFTSRVGGNGTSTAASDQASEDGNDSVSGKKVKFLCSFGGKILPRPSDGMLRYVGGQTRIISVRRDVTFGELVQKMMDAYGQPVVIKYQLPDEDLDALVSVSCPDDLDNMMEEYEKLLERSADGSAKLRVFLFSASELDPSGLVQLGDLQDTGQKYVDAVNGIAEGGVGGITRKESLASVASTQNSDVSGTEALDGVVGQDVSGLPSAGLFSPRSDSAASTDNAPKSDTSTPPLLVPASASLHAASSQPEIEIERSVPLQVPVQPPPLGYDMQQRGVNFPPLSPYMGHQDAFSRMDYQKLPPQVVYPNPQVLGAPRPILIRPQFRENAPTVLAPQFVPAVQMTMAPPSSHLNMNPNIVQPLVQPPRVVAVPADHSYSNTYPAQVGGGYGWHQVSAQDHVAISEGWMPHQQVIPRMVDCYMCQKALPHAHSDTVVADQKDGHSTTVSEANPIHHSLHLDDITRIRAMTPQNQGLVGLAGDVRAHYGAVRGNVPISCSEDAIEQHLAPSSEAKQDVLVSKPINCDTASVGGVNYQIPEQFVPATSKDYSGKVTGAAFWEDEVRPAISHELVCPLDFMMDNFQVKPADVLPSSEQGMSAVDQHKKDDVFEQVVSQNLGKETHSNAAFNRPAAVPETILPKPSDMLPCSIVEVAFQRNVRPADVVEVVQASALGNAVSNPQQKIGRHHFDGSPLYPVADAAYVGDRSSPGSDLRDAAAKFQVVSPSGCETVNSNSSVQSSISPNAWAALMNDSPNSLFSNQDPWNMRQDAHFPPPKPNKIVMKRDACAMREIQADNPSGLSGESNAEAYFLEGIRPTTELSHAGIGLAEEQAGQQLQATAEGVAASVLHSSPSNPDLSSHETTVSVSEVGSETEGQSNSGAVLQAKLEAINLKPEKTNLGFPMSDGLGRLQIIKNSDLEELRELGSGTFGTVYHGKWRGTDVAIKRINDRCFAGKTSEQERMRDDFWNEAIKLADLHHPNVVAFYGVVLDGPGGSVATVTEYMVNGSLRNALQKNERNLDKRKRLLIAMDVAFGMEYLHSKNIVHFDLKSDNLLVNLRDPHRPICKVGDLGLSKVKCQTLISGGVRGTLPWMAPELLNGSSSLVSEKVDVFSFGIVLWELLTGEEPYADLHYGAIIGGIVSNTLRPPVPENCDPEWRSLMERCWSAEPSERPSFTEIANELRAMAAKLPLKGQTPSANTRTNV